MEFPDGARLSDSDNDDARSETDPHRALNIDLEEYVHHLLFPFLPTKSLQVYQAWLKFNFFKEKTLKMEMKWLDIR